MKYLLFLYISVWSIVSCLAQTPDTKTCAQYKAAFDCILRDSVNQDKTIFVVDSIVDLDRHFFIAQMNEHPCEQAILENERMRFDWAANQYSPILNRLFGDYKNVDAKIIVLFSDITDNMLVANCVNWNDNRGAPVPKLSVECIISFTESLNYLFLFDDSGIIKKVSRIKMQYD